MINLVTSEKKVYFTKLTLLNWRRRFSIRVLLCEPKTVKQPISKMVKGKQNKTV